MLGVIVNAAAVVIGCLLGLLFRKGISERISGAVMISIGLCTAAIGIVGILKGENQLVLIVCMVLGTIVGTWIDLDRRLEKLGAKVESLFKVKSGSNRVAQGFITATLLFCIGSMTLTGSIAAGLSGDNSILFTKSMLDFISACMLSVTFGIGVMLSAVSVLVLQGGIVLLSGALSGILSACANEVICCGSVMILAIGLNIMGIAKIKISNLLPALLFVPPVVYLFGLF